MKKSKTILIFISSIIITLVIVGMLVFFLNIIKNKNQHISAVTTTLEKKLKEKEEIQLFIDQLSEIKFLETTINSRFVDSNKIDQFVSYLEDLDKDTGAEIVVKSIEVSPKIKNIISFKILITGNFQEVMGTLTILENIPYEVNINQVYLNKDLISQIITEKDKEVLAPSIPSWQADVGFNILSTD